MRFRTYDLNLLFLDAFQWIWLSDKTDDALIEAKIGAYGITRGLMGFLLGSYFDVFASCSEMLILLQSYL